MADYLVTGGCGFIGSHLCEALLAQGAGVRILDDFSTGSADNAPSGSVLLRGSVSDPEIVDSAMRDVAGCFHLAAIASVERSTEDWLGSHQTNLSGAIAVFNAARRLSQGRPIPVVYASSAAIYGNCTQLPIRESTPPKPQSAYAVDKYGCELHARIAADIYGVPTVGLRLFNVYGPRQNPASPYSGVISTFCDRLLRGEAVEIFGDGSQTRDFVFVSDVIAAMLAAMAKVEKRPTSSKIYNVCTGKRTSIFDLARLIGKVCKFEPDIHFRPARDGDIVHSCGDPHLLHAELNLAEPVELATGLGITLLWLQDICFS